MESTKTRARDLLDRAESETRAAPYRLPTAAARRYAAEALAILEWDLADRARREGVSE